MRTRAVVGFIVSKKTELAFIRTYLLSGSFLSEFIFKKFI